MTDTCEIEVERMEVQEVLKRSSAVEIVTNCSSTDLEVGGSIVISNMEEPVIDSRRASISEEESAEEKNNIKHAIKKFVVWKTFKSIVFLICLIVFIMQSVEFLTDYYKYPTKIETEITVTTEMKLPVVTFCFWNTMPLQKFCLYEPDRCYRPRDMEEFCREHRFLCRGNTTDLKNGDVFSHIGGLLGCWLGVSVFTFTDILEKFLRKVVRWKRRFRKRRFTLRRFRKRRFTLKRFRKRKEQRAPHTSEIHQE